MRRPVTVKVVLLLPDGIFCLSAKPPLSPSFHPHSLLSDDRSVPVGRTRFSRCCYLSIDLYSLSLRGTGPGLSCSHLISAAELGCSVLTLCRHLYLVAISQWFVHLSAHPQLMKQYCQLPGHRNDGAFLGIFSSSLGKSQSSSPQITVFSKGSQNVVCALHHHRSQVAVSLFADVQLRLALPGVPASRSQPEKASDVATLPESMRIFYRQDKRQRDQVSYTLDLLE